MQLCQSPQKNAIHGYVYIVHARTETKDKLSMIHVSLERHYSMNKDLNQFEFCIKPPLKVSDFAHQMCMRNLESGKYGMSCMEDTSNYGTYSLRISSILVITVTIVTTIVTLTTSPAPAPP